MLQKARSHSCWLEILRKLDLKGSERSDNLILHLNRWQSERAKEKRLSCGKLLTRYLILTTTAWGRQHNHCAHHLPKVTQLNMWVENSGLSNQCPGAVLAISDLHRWGREGPIWVTGREQQGRARPGPLALPSETPTSYLLRKWSQRCLHCISIRAQSWLGNKGPRTWIKQLDLYQDFCFQGNFR